MLFNDTAWGYVGYIVLNLVKFTLGINYFTFSAAASYSVVKLIWDLAVAVAMTAPGTSPSKAINAILTPVRASRQTICAICTNQASPPVKLSCGHTFCDMCIRKNLTVSDTCPLDRKPLFDQVNVPVMPTFNSPIFVIGLHVVLLCVALAPAGMDHLPRGRTDLTGSIVLFLVNSFEGNLHLVGQYSLLQYSYEVFIGPGLQPTHNLKSWVIYLTLSVAIAFSNASLQSLRYWLWSLVRDWCLPSIMICIILLGIEFYRQRLARPA